MGQPAHTIKSGQWSRSAIDRCKSAVQQELRGLSSLTPKRLILNYIADELRKLEGANDSESSMRNYVLRMSALVHHQRHGGLRKSQVQNLVEGARAVLVTQGVMPGRSRLSYLFAELHSIISQIKLIEGDYWSAAWENQLSFHLITRKTETDRYRFMLGSAIRYLRMGEGQQAIDLLAKVEKESDTFQRKARIQRLRAFRLHGDYNAAKELIFETLSQWHLSENELSELQWEEMCLAITTEANLGPMIKSLQPKGSHRQSDYVVEGFFWKHAFTPHGDKFRLLSPESMAKDSSLGVGDQGYFFHCAKVLHQCQDKNYSLEHRLWSLGRILNRTEEITTIDRQLLVLAAASRWLAQAQAFGFARLVLSEYRNICLRLSGGHSRDVLCVVEELFERSWWQD